MANKWVLANGNWSNAANWNGGTLPTSADDVYANNFTVTIDQNVTVLSLRNTSTTGVNAGGRFIVNGVYTLNITGTGIVATNATVLEIQTSTGSTTTINSTNISLTVNNGAASSVILITSNGTINFNSNITAGGVVLTYFVLISGNATVNWVGTIIHGGALQGQVFGISAASATLNFTGSNTTVSNYYNGIVLFGGSSAAQTTSTINITGNITGPTAFYTTWGPILSNGILNITGTLKTSPVSGGAGNSLISAGSGNITTISGIIESDTQRKLVVSTSGLLTVDGQINCVNEGWPISATRLRLKNSASTQITFQTDVVSTNKTLYEPGTALGNPAITDVRSGVTYASGALTGTMIVPSPSNVRVGVPTDNTVGAGQLTAADFLSAIASSLDPVAVRLNNVSTTQTTGAQISSFNV